ncbi:MAG TPA: hypothetical protein VF755_06160 [Catenuloplanes sp.]|jgi:hypothetical protein
MSDGELRLDPVTADRGGRDLTHAGRQLTGQRDGLGNQIAAASAARPWGDDEIGAAFERNYRDIERSILAAWSSVGHYVEGLGGAVVTSVSNSVGTDTQNGQRIRGTRP